MGFDIEGLYKEVIEGWIEVGRELGMVVYPHKKKANKLIQGGRK